jgi:hypothetical protein
LKLREYGLVLNLEKCIFGQTEIDFLGHHVTAGGVQPLEDHVAAVRDFAPPRDRVQLQRFLGLLTLNTVLYFDTFNNRDDLFKTRRHERPL